MNDKKKIKEIEEIARVIRKNLVCLALKAGSQKRGAHIGPGLSIVDITTTLYMNFLNYDIKNPTWPDRDRFILSKGHGILGLYPVLAEVGLLPFDLLKGFYNEESILAGHPVLNPEIGIEASTGSLGHGLSIAVGIALSAKIDKKDFHTYVLVGDGECNEGTIWEGIMSARKYRLDNLTAIVDLNGLQADGFTEDIMDMDSMSAKWGSFKWNVINTDGHDINSLLSAFDKKNRVKDIPTVIIASTTKGKGISFCENNKVYHHSRDFDREKAVCALNELGFKEGDIR